MFREIVIRVTYQDPCAFYYNFTQVKLYSSQVANEEIQLLCVSGEGVRSLRPLWRKTLTWPFRLYINLVFQVVIALCWLGNFSFLIHEIVAVIFLLML